MVSQKGVEKRIGITMMDLAKIAITPEDMLVKARYSLGEGSDADLIKPTKDEVYKRIVQYLYVDVSLMDRLRFMEANVNDLVLSIIIPIIYDFKCRTGRNVTPFREKQIIFQDSKTGGYEESVVVDMVSVTEEKYVLIVEAKREPLSAAMGQCLLVMKDMGDISHCVVYGFVTTGDSWRMLSYDGGSFMVTDKLHVVFDTMGKNKDKWMRDYLLLVDCMYAALSNGGIVKKDVVVQG